MIPAEKVLKARNKFSKMTSARDRLVPEVFPAIQPSFKMQKSDRVFCIGSCFARNVEKHLIQLGFCVPSADFSVPNNEYKGETRNSILNKYTPTSVSQEVAFNLKRIAAGKQSLSWEDVEPLMYASESAQEGKYIDTQLTGFVPVTQERALARRNEIYELFKGLTKSNVLVLTLGLIECWYDNELSMFIQQVPTAQMLQKKGRYCFHRTHYAESKNHVKKALDLIAKENRSINVLITTSPVTLNRTFTSDDIITANLYSKSVLRAVAGEIADEYSNVDYFPSFESVILTKSWDVFNDNLIHVDDRFVGKIMSQVVNHYLDDDTPARSLTVFDLEELLADEKFDELVREFDSLGSGRHTVEPLTLAYRGALRLNDARRISQYQEFILSIENDALEKDKRALALITSLLLEIAEDDFSTRLHSKLLGAGMDLGWYHFERAKQYVKEARYEEAEHSARTAIDIMPNDARSRYMLGTALFRLGRGDEAEQEALRAVELNSKVPGFHRLLAKIYEA